MKNLLLSLVVLFLFSLLPSLQVNAQQTCAVSKYKYDEEKPWTSLEVKDSGINMLDGVMFLQKSSTSKSQEIFIILKIINMNSYAVKVQWEESAGVIKEIIVPANSVTVGNADAANKDSDESKLVFSKSISEEAKQFMLSSISVSKVK